MFKGWGGCRCGGGGRCTGVDEAKLTGFMKASLKEERRRRGRRRVMEGRWWKIPVLLMAVLRVLVTVAARGRPRKLPVIRQPQAWPDKEAKDRN